MKRKITIKDKISEYRKPPPPIPKKEASKESIQKEVAAPKINRKKIQIKRKVDPVSVYASPTPQKQIEPVYTPPKVEPLIEETSNFDINQYKKKKKPWTLITGILVIVFGAGGYFLKPIFFGETEKNVIKPTKIVETPPKEAMVTDAKQPYEGFVLENYHLIQGAIGEENYIAAILEKHGLSENQIQKVVDHGRNVAGLNPLNHGRPYVILAEKTVRDSLQFLIYEPNDYQYIVLGLEGKGSAKLVERKIQMRVQIVAGMIKGEETLWDAVLRNQFRSELIEKMEEALKWSVDFYHVQPGDKFKVVYDEKFEGNKSVGVGQVYAVYFTTNGKEYYAYNYEYQREQSFYNEEARPMKSTFLMSPVKYARISSNYNLQRKHPVTGEVKGHFGTDYAAPEGSPILAVADGIVTIAAHKTNNGNYVKLKHDETYSSQYLHMQKFEPEVGEGTRVKQGQVIGYVGQTGLATGPHVCFRFWKDGKQVNHLEEDLPLPSPLVESETVTFQMFRDSFNVLLSGVNYYN